MPLPPHSACRHASAPQSRPCYNPQLPSPHQWCCSCGWHQRSLWLWSLRVHPNKRRLQKAFQWITGSSFTEMWVDALPVLVRTRMTASKPMLFCTSFLRSLRKCSPSVSTWKHHVSQSLRCIFAQDLTSRWQCCYKCVQFWWQTELSSMS